MGLYTRHYSTVEPGYIMLLGYVGHLREWDNLHVGVGQLALYGETAFSLRAGPGYVGHGTACAGSVEAF